MLGSSTRDLELEGAAQYHSCSQHCTPLDRDLKCSCDLLKPLLQNGGHRPPTAISDPGIFLVSSFSSSWCCYHSWLPHRWPQPVCPLCPHHNVTYTTYWEVPEELSMITLNIFGDVFHFDLGLCSPNRCSCALSQLLACDIPSTLTPCYMLDGVMGFFDQVFLTRPMYFSNLYHCIGYFKWNLLKVWKQYLWMIHLMQWLVALSLIKGQTCPMYMSSGITLKTIQFVPLGADINNLLAPSGITSNFRLNILWQ